MDKADIVLHNANVLTLWPDYPRCSTLAIKDGKVLAVSPADDPEPYIGAGTEMVDCLGMTVLPGFHDAHCHPVGYAETMISTDFSHPTVHSISEIQNTLGKVAKSTPSGRWIRARGYSEFYLAEKRHPNRFDLDAATISHPIKLTHRSGHVHVLNSLGLRLAGISCETTEPPGSIIERDIDTGEPNGVLYEMNSYLSNVVPLLSNEEFERALKLASQQFVSMGITSLQDASSHNNLKRWRMFQKYKANDIFKPRVTMMIGSESFPDFQKHGFTQGTGDGHLRLGAVKIILDMTTGIMNPSQDELDEKVGTIHRLGFQTAIHAMELETVEAACLSLEKALSRYPRKDHRHRIEHCSICKPAMAKRLGKLGVVVTTQPAFIYYNGERYLKTIPPDAIKYLYPVSTLRKARLNVAAGSDCPVVPPNPLHGIYSAVTRMTEAGRSVSPGQCVGIEEALSLYTDNAAFSCFQEHVCGSLSPGKYADIVVIDRNLISIPEDEIKDLEVIMTIIGGEIVWRKESLVMN